MISPEQEIARFIGSGTYEGHDVKIIGRMGDAAAVAVTKVFGEKELRPDDIDRILMVVHISFAAPRVVENESDRQPRTTLFLLRYLDRSTTDPALKRRIAETREYVHDKYAESMQETPKK
jgi:hypothetical protein